MEPPSWRSVEGVDEEEIMTIHLSPVGHLSWRFIRATLAFAFAPSSTTFTLLQKVKAWKWDLGRRQSDQRPGRTVKSQYTFCLILVLIGVTVMIWQSLEKMDNNLERFPLFSMFKLDVVNYSTRWSSFIDPCLLVLTTDHLCPDTKILSEIVERVRVQ